MAKFCFECGSLLRQDSKFCGECGIALGEIQDSSREQATANTELSANFEWAIPAKYDSIPGKFSEGLYSAAIGTYPGKVEFEFCDKSGERQFILTDDGQSEFGAPKFAGGLARHSISIDGNNLYGFVDKRGNWVIKPSFPRVGEFDEELTYAYKTKLGQCGLIDKTGNFVVPPEHGDIGTFQEGLVAVTDQAFGTYVLSEVHRDPRPAWGWRNRSKVLNFPKMTGSSRFSEGLAGIRFVGDDGMYGKFGYINTGGDVVIEPIYESGKEFSEGLAAVAIDDPESGDFSWQYIDQSGTAVIQLGYLGDNPSVGEFRQGLALVEDENAERNQQLRYIDREGNVVLTGNDEWTLKVQRCGNLFSVKFLNCDDKVNSNGFVNIRGEVVVPATFDFIDDNESLEMIRVSITNRTYLDDEEEDWNDNSKYGFINIFSD